MANNITYLFGAGASYHAVPIVSEMGQAMAELKEIIQRFSKDITTKHKAEDVKGVNELVLHLEYLSNIENTYKTIDTYARKLVLSKDTNELRKLKATISIFFELWQSYSLRRRLNIPNEHESYLTFDKDFIDNRYTALFSNLLEDRNGRIQFNEKVNFLTWNYDVQIPKALNLFLSKNRLSEIFSEIGIYPGIEKTHAIGSPKIIYLNGVAGMYELPERKSVNSLMDRIEMNNELLNFITNLTFVYQKQERGELNFDNSFSFAWEKTHIANQARDQAKEIMRKTNVLVVIGYSFPTFNLTVDRELMKAFTDNDNDNNKVIYYQDRNPNKEIIRDSFGFQEKRIFINENTDQFLIPRQYL